jgi:hypothetical protein
MTNFQEWIFTRYSLTSEAEQIIDKNGRAAPLSDVNPFEMSKVFRVINKRKEVDMDQLY